MNQNNSNNENLNSFMKNRHETMQSVAEFMQKNYEHNFENIWNYSKNMYKNVLKNVVEGANQTLQSFNNVYGDALSKEANASLKNAEQHFIDLARMNEQMAYDTLDLLKKHNNLVSPAQAKGNANQLLNSYQAFEKQALNMYLQYFQGENATKSTKRP